MVGKMFSPLTVYKIVHNLFPMLKINTTTNFCKLCLMALTKQPLNIRTLEIFKTNQYEIIGYSQGTNQELEPNQIWPL